MSADILSSLYQANRIRKTSKEMLTNTKYSGAAAQHLYFSSSFSVIICPMPNSTITENKSIQSEMCPFQFQNRI